MPHRVKSRSNLALTKNIEYDTLRNYYYLIMILYSVSLHRKIINIEYKKKTVQHFLALEIRKHSVYETASRCLVGKQLIPKQG